MGDLFSGIGGFSLAARWMGWETKWFAEIDPYCDKVLKKHWPDVPNLGDLTKVDWSTVEPVDLMAGGFPCQDISIAGAGLGIDGERSGLWREYLRAIRNLRPRYLVVENVAALLGRGLERVLGELAEIGYDAEWTVLDGADHGVPQQRERVFVVGYPRTHRALRVLQNCPAMARRRTGAQDVGPSLHHTLTLRAESVKHGNLPVIVAECPNPSACANGQGVRATNGLSRRMDVARYRALGNSIIPQCALHIFRAIQAAEDAMKGEPAA